MDLLRTSKKIFIPVDKTLAMVGHWWFSNCRFLVVLPPPHSPASPAQAGRKKWRGASSDRCGSAPSRRWKSEWGVKGGILFDRKISNSINPTKAD
jgi:hypothetical protein